MVPMSGVDHASDHDEVAHEKPEDWGWIADLGKLARIGGWISVFGPLIQLTATHYNLAGDIALIGTTVLLVIGLLFDRHQRKVSWRK